MTHRRWTTAFIVSFIPLGLWMLFWLLRAASGGFGQGGQALAFIIPTVLFVGFQVWLAFRAFTT